MHDVARCSGDGPCRTCQLLHALLALLCASLEDLLDCRCPLRCCPMLKLYWPLAEWPGLSADANAPQLHPATAIAAQPGNGILWSQLIQPALTSALLQTCS